MCSGSSNFSEYETYILGDINTDVKSKSPTCIHKSALKSFMSMFHYKQLNSSFTRVGTTSSSIFDLILVSDCDKALQHGTIQTCFSDQFLIY